MKEVDVTHSELGMFVWYIKHLLKANKVSLSQVVALELSVESKVGGSLGSLEMSTDKNDMKEVDVTHIELVTFVWYIKHLPKAQQVQLSQVVALELSVESLNLSTRISASTDSSRPEYLTFKHFLCFK